MANDPPISYETQRPALGPRGWVHVDVSSGPAVDALPPICIGCLGRATRHIKLPTRRGGPTFVFPVCPACHQHWKRREQALFGLSLILLTAVYLIALASIHWAGQIPFNDAWSRATLAPAALLLLLYPLYMRFGAVVEVAVVTIFLGDIWIRFRNRAYSAIYLDILEPSSRKGDRSRSRL